MNTSGAQPDGGSMFSVQPEFILLIAGCVLTLIVMAFVGYLITQIVKEERGKATPTDGGSQQDE